MARYCCEIAICFKICCFRFYAKGKLVARPGCGGYTPPPLPLRRNMWMAPNIKSGINMTQMLVASLKLMSSRWRHIININHHQSSPKSSYRYSYNHHHWLSELLAGPAKGGAEVARGDGGQVDRVHWHHGQDRPSWCQWQSVDHYLYLIAMMRIKSQWWQCSHLFSAASVRLKQGWQASTIRDGKVQTWWSLYDDHDDDYDFYKVCYHDYYHDHQVFIIQFASSHQVLSKSSPSPLQVFDKYQHVFTQAAASEGELLEPSSFQGTADKFIVRCTSRIFPTESCFHSFQGHNGLGWGGNNILQCVARNGYNNIMNAMHTNAHNACNKQTKHLHTQRLGIVGTFLQGKTSLTKEDIATVFSLYDRVSPFHQQLQALNKTVKAKVWMEAISLCYPGRFWSQNKSDPLCYKAVWPFSSLNLIFQKTFDQSTTVARVSLRSCRAKGFFTGSDVQNFRKVLAAKNAGNKGDSRIYRNSDILESFRLLRKKGNCTEKDNIII